MRSFLLLLLVFISHTAFASNKYDSLLRQVEIYNFSYKYDSSDLLLNSINTESKNFDLNTRLHFNALQVNRYRNWEIRRGASYYMAKCKSDLEQSNDLNLIKKVVFQEVLNFQYEKKIIENPNTIKKNREEITKHYGKILTQTNESWTYFDYLLGACFQLYVANDKDSAINLFNKQIEVSDIENSEQFYWASFAFRLKIPLERYKKNDPLYRLKPNPELLKSLHTLLQLCIKKRERIHLPDVYNAFVIESKHYKNIDSVKHYISLQKEILDSLGAINYQNNRYFLRHVKYLYDNELSLSKFTNDTKMQLRENNYLKSEILFIEKREQLNNYLNDQLEQINKVEKAEATNRLFKYSILALLLGGLIVTQFLLYKRRKSKQLLIQSELKRKNLEEVAKNERILGELKGQEQERKSIAKELHDVVANSIGGIKNYVETANTTQDAEKRNQLLNQTYAQLSNLYQKIRNLSHIMDTPKIAEDTFCEEIKNLLVEYQMVENFELHYSLYPEELLNKLPLEIQKDLFLLLQELLLNTHKHANATTVETNLTINDKELNLLFEDNGKGINTEDIEKKLRSIKHRASLLKGEIHIDSPQNGGTNVVLSVPLNVQL